MATAEEREIVAVTFSNYGVFTAASHKHILAASRIRRGSVLRLCFFVAD